MNYDRNRHRKSVARKKAFVYRSGVIVFSDVHPRGTLPVIGLDGKPVARKKIEAGARLAYDGKTLLVPGVPEAEDGDAALDALNKWINWLTGPVHKEGS